MTDEETNINQEPFKQIIFGSCDAHIARHKRYSEESKFHPA